MAKEEPAEMESAIQRKIAVFPGAFKPPHRGHMDVVEHFASVADQVVILISPLDRKTPAGKSIDKSVSEKIWQIYIDAKGIGNKVSIGSSPYNSPVQASFEVLKGNVPDFIPESGDLIIPVASDKPDKKGSPDYTRFLKFHEGLPDMIPGVVPANIEEYFYKAPSEGALSAGDFRAALDTGEGLERFLPTSVSAQEVLAVLGVEVEPEMDEEEPEAQQKNDAPLPFFMGEDLMEMIKESLDKELGLEEMSSMAGGSVEGFAGGNKNKKSIINEEEPEDINERTSTITGPTYDPEYGESGLSTDPNFDPNKAYEQSISDDQLATATGALETIGNVATSVVPIKKVAKVVGGIEDSMTAVDVGKKSLEGDVKGAGESALSWIPGYDAAAAGLQTAMRDWRGYEGDKGSAKRTAYDVRQQATDNPEGTLEIHEIGDDLMKNLVANPEVADKAYQKGWIDQNAYATISRGRKHVGSWKQPAEKTAPVAKQSAKKTTTPVSENQIKNQDEHIIEEVLDYLLSKMEIL